MRMPPAQHHPPVSVTCLLCIRGGGGACLRCIAACFLPLGHPSNARTSLPPPPPSAPPSESYMAYNPKTSKCNGKDPLYCVHGQSCTDQLCICLFGAWVRARRFGALPQFIHRGPAEELRPWCAVV